MTTSQPAKALPMAFPSEAEFRNLLRKQEERQRQYREQLCEALKTAEMPLSEDLRTKVIHLSHSDREEVLHCHPGREMAERISSYRTSLDVFEASVADLLGVIDVFARGYGDGEILQGRNKDELRRLERSVQKELFSAANAAHALVDHSTRRLKNVADTPGIAEKLAEAFGNDGLHEFVIGLRTVLHHIRMVQAGWQFQHSYRSGTGTASFMLGKDLMFRVFKQERERFSGTQYRRTIAFISSFERDIDLAAVFDEYRRRVRTFHTWFSEVVHGDSFKEARDYELCQKEGRNFGIRMNWSALIGNWLNWSVPPNPYNHLDRFLTPAELAEVIALPKGSVEQIDMIIEFVDDDCACDENMRKLIQMYFAKAIAAHP